MIGTRLGKYEIIEELGRGGMATVYRAYQPSAGRYVAIKVIHRALATDKLGMERFEREAQLLSRLEHPYLLPVFDVNITNDPPYIVMRYLEGGTLKEVIEQRTIVPMGEVLYLMRQIAGALDYAHRQGVVHRDIKPSNIMVDEDGNAFLTDFGIARINEGEGLTQTGFTVGTPGYMSPEQGMADDVITPAADVYSLGVMLYEMVTGKSPYGGSTPMAILMKHIQEPIPSAVKANPDLPEEIDEIIQKSMAKDPDNRYQAAGDLVADLATIVDTSEMRSAPETLMTIATIAAQGIRQKRKDQEDEINTLMEGFAAARTRPDENIMPDVATQLTPSAEVQGIGAGQTSDNNRTTYIVIGVVVVVALVVGLLLAASGGPSDVDLTQTQVAFLAETEANRPTETPTETSTQSPTPSDTPTITATDPPTNTPRPLQPTETFAVAAVAAIRNIDVRLGPGSNFTVVSTLAANDSLEITGRTEDNRWLQVLRLDGSEGWILQSGTVTRILGGTDLSDVPIVEGPTLTPSRTPTATPSSTNTPTPTNTPTATNTPSPTPNRTQTAIFEETSDAATEQAIEATQVRSTAVALQIVNEAATLSAVETADAILTESSIQLTNDKATANAVEATSDAIATLDAIEATNDTATQIAEDATNEAATQQIIEATNMAATNVAGTQFAIMRTDTAATEIVVEETNSAATLVAIEATNAAATIRAIELTSAVETQVVLDMTANAEATLTRAFETQIAETFIAFQTQNAPTATHTPTATPTPTATSTPTSTPTFRPTEPPLASPTPRPLGLMPYVADFESDTPLEGWDYPGGWSTLTEGGQSILLGQAGPSDTAHIMGLEAPEWLTADDFVVSFRVNIGNAAGTRLIFRSVFDQGYNALDIREGVIFLNRNNLQVPNIPSDFATANNEIRLQTTRLPIRLNEWNEFTIWVEGQRIFVYHNKELVIQAEDLNQPQLGAGDIFLQNLTGAQAMRYDDIVIQRAEPSSDHFQASQISPSTWQFTDQTPISLQTEGSGNQYVFIRGATEFSPIMAPVRDFELRCRLWSDQGGYKIILRDNEAGRWEMNGVAGNLDLNYFTSGEESVFSTEIRNFFTRGLWQDLHVIFIENRFELYLDGELEFEDTLEASPAAGTIKFVTSPSDFLRIDDCLLTQSAATRDTGAQFAFELRDEVEARDFRDRQSDYLDPFSDVAFSPIWWGDNAPGQYLTDTTVADHQSFLRMTHLGTPTFRLFKNNLGVSLFPGDPDEGQANVNNKSTDVLVSVDVRFLPNTTGEAWMNVRATRSGSGGQGVFGYRFAIQRDINGNYNLNISQQERVEQEFYNGVIPGSANEVLPEWVNLSVITLDDKLAFFANDRFVVFIDNATKLDGTIALGVEPGTTADFDTFIVRDTSPLGQ